MAITVPMIFFSGFFASFVSQIIKSLFKARIDKEWHWSYMFEPAGMPSSHTAAVTATALTIYILQGFSPLFFFSLLFVMYVIDEVMFIEDSVSNLARISNEIVGFIGLPMHKAKKHKHLLKEPFREEWGHTPQEVAAGFIIGLIVVGIIYSI